MNLHKNFKNLAPMYDKMRYNRALKLADVWKMTIGEKMKKKYDDQYRKNFNEYVEKGGKLTYEEIHELSNTLKADYITHVLHECD